jgi:hypothetical protein
VNVDDEGNVISILDSKTVLKGYRALFELAEVNYERVIVHVNSPVVKLRAYYLPLFCRVISEPA